MKKNIMKKNNEITILLYFIPIIFKFQVFKFQVSSFQVFKFSSFQVFKLYSHWIVIYTCTYFPSEIHTDPITLPLVRFSTWAYTTFTLDANFCFEYDLQYSAANVMIWFGYTSAKWFAEFTCKSCDITTWDDGWSSKWNHKSNGSELSIKFQFSFAVWPTRIV